MTGGKEPETRPQNMISAGPIQTWRSDWSTGKGIDDLFQPGPLLTPTKDPATGKMSVTLTIGADQVVTASSLPRSTHGHRGAAPTPAPASAPFPATYENDFEREDLNSEDLYFSDQAGKWEIRQDASDPSNQVLKHVSPAIGVVYRGDTRPISVLGDVNWADAAVSMRFRLEDAHAQGFFVSLRTLNAPDGSAQGGNLPQATDIAGVYVVLSLDGTWRLVNSTRDHWNSTIRRGEIGTGNLQLHAWYNVSMAVKAEELTWSVVPTAKGGTASSVHTATLAADTFAKRGQLAIGPSRTLFASRSVRRPLLTLQVNPGSLYRCGQER